MTIIHVESFIAKFSTVSIIMNTDELQRILEVWSFNDNSIKAIQIIDIMVFGGSDYTRVGLLETLLIKYVYKL